MRTIAALAIAVIALSGCSANSEPAPASDQAFLSLLDAYWKTGATDNNAKTIEAGHLACDRMRAGAKLNAIAQLADGKIGAGGLIEADSEKIRLATNFVAAAAKAYCPEQLTMAPTGLPPTATRTPAPSTPLSDSAVSDAAFIAALTGHRIAYSSRSAVITLGHAVCDARRAGNTTAVVALTIAEKGYSIEDAGYIVGAAQSAYCPQYN